MVLPKPPKNSPISGTAVEDLLTLPPEAWELPEEEEGLDEAEEEDGLEEPEEDGFSAAPPWSGSGSTSPPGWIWGSATS